MGLGIMIPDSCMECEILPTCKIVPRWMTKETQEELKKSRMKRCPYNLFVGRNDADGERREE